MLDSKYKSESLDIKEAYFDEELYITNMHEESRKNQTVSEWCWCRCGKFVVMDINVEC